MQTLILTFSILDNRQWDKKSESGAMMAAVAAQAKMC
jgi:hypothetical protein